MRQIDADALIERLEARSPDPEGVGEWIEIIQSQPTVNPQEPSGDLISREETLTAFADYVGSGMSMDDFDALWSIVAKMPVVKQEPKTGHWVEHEHDGVAHIECSECLSWFLRSHLLRNSYCPNCGARMVKK